MNPYVFFVGCPRSGTTLLLRIGDAHAELATIGELHWLPRWWKRGVGITPEGFVTRELVDRLIEDRRFRKLRVDPAQVAALIEEDRPKHYARFVTELFDLHGAVTGKRLVGEKTPGYVRSLPTLHQLWPHARVAHLIRDGRDVALSLQDRTGTSRAAWRIPTWKQDPVTTAAVFWEWNVRLGRDARLGPDLYQELRYEELIADPEQQCRRLCRFLALDFDPAMLRFHEGRSSPEPGLSAKRAWLPVTPGLRSWREQMPSEDVARFEAAAGDLLEELGYARAAPSPSAAAVERARHVRDAFTERARARRLPVPKEWEAVAA